MPNPAIGRVVHVRLPDLPGQETPNLRPAMIVRVHVGGTVNVNVQLDGGPDTPAGKLKGETFRDGLTVHCHHLVEGSAVGDWRWPEIR